MGKCRITVLFPPLHSALPVQHAWWHLQVCLLSSALRAALHAARQGCECAVQLRVLFRERQPACHLNARWILLSTSAARDGSPGTTTRRRWELSIRRKHNAHVAPNLFPV